MALTNVFLVWVGYEGFEIFASREDAENYCYNNCGPDRAEWHTIQERVLEPVARNQPQDYFAIAWWPSWDYRKAPRQPYVTVQFGAPPNADDDSGPQYGGRGATAAVAKKLAIAAANQHRPSYEYAQSSATTSGVLAIYRRSDFHGRLG